MEKSPLEVGLVHIKSLQGARQLQQVINQQIASESWRGAKNGGETEGDAVGLFQDGILASLLGLAVQRSRVALGVGCFLVIFTSSRLLNRFK